METSDDLNDFIATYVAPCLKVNADSCKPELAGALACFDNYLASGKPTELEGVNIKIATGYLSGRIDKHPLLQGLSVLCMRRLDRLERDIDPDRPGKRKGFDSETAKCLAKDSACTLAIACHSKVFLKKCGVSKSAARVDLIRCFQMVYHAQRLRCISLMSSGSMRISSTCSIRA
mgnify:CR=1 FL=1